ncbi:MAG: hypothetical protein MNSN_02130 [Minisyncoccus archaeiphilus]|uniref:hypothetical protein n=1 Tax=Minisyncoccus archaeiphilus TaxID=3238481 RepID=UPI002B177D9F|nr:MAG: hypothetical protein MNSN_02130 [Candidatus Parcubacteria bacterium]
MSKLKFSINSIEEEIAVYDKTLENMKLYEKHKVIFTLPQKKIEEEYSLDRYNAFISLLKKRWTEENEIFIDKSLMFFNKDKNTQFTVKISNYGVLGSYSDKRNEATLNYCIKDIDFNPIRIIKHEIIHILVEPFIEEYSINHEKKEFIVNSVLEVMND